IQPAELVTLGYRAPTEAFGEFFRGAFGDPGWLSRYRTFLTAEGRPVPSNAALAAIVRRTALVEMLYLRRYAFAKIASERALHERPAAEAREVYRRTHSTAYAFELNKAESQRFLTDADDYSADYARAFALAAMMHEGI